MPPGEEHGDPGNGGELRPVVVGLEPDAPKVPSASTAAKAMNPGQGASHYRLAPIIYR
jgi:hypothetical protein